MTTLFPTRTKLAFPPAEAVQGGQTLTSAARTFQKDKVRQDVRKDIYGKHNQLQRRGHVRTHELHFRREDSDVES